MALVVVGRWASLNCAASTSEHAMRPPKYVQPAPGAHAHQPFVVLPAAILPSAPMAAMLTVSWDPTLLCVPAEEAASKRRPPMPPAGASLVALLEGARGV